MPRVLTKTRFRRRNKSSEGHHISNSTPSHLRIQLPLIFGNDSTVVWSAELDVLLIRLLWQKQNTAFFRPSPISPSRSPRHPFLFLIPLPLSSLLFQHSAPFLIPALFCLPSPLSFVSLFLSPSSFVFCLLKIDSSLPGTRQSRLQVSSSFALRPSAPVLRCVQSYASTLVLQANWLKSLPPTSGERLCRQGYARS